MNKTDIARIVRAFELPPSNYGTCLRRVRQGLTVLRDLGIPATPMIGGMIYRAPTGQTLRYCNERGLPTYQIGVSVTAHYWINSGDELIDFSCGDWPIRPPFSFLWGDARKFGGPPYPAIGRAWYGCGSVVTAVLQ